MLMARSNRSRRQASANVNYKEKFDNTDSDKTIEDDSTEQEGAISSNQQDEATGSDIKTIDKILAYRIGKIGATGVSTTLYNVEANGDPNDIPKSLQEQELQFLIKRRGKLCKKIKVDVENDISEDDVGSVFENESANSDEQLSDVSEDVVGTNLVTSNDTPPIADIQHVLESPISHASFLQKNLPRKCLFMFVIPILIMIGSFHLFNYPDVPTQPSKIAIDLKLVDDINQDYPGLLNSKQVRIIKARLATMLNEVSILMLLGKSRDFSCRSDPTFCLGKRIANITKSSYDYIDVSGPDLQFDVIHSKFGRITEFGINIVIFDNLEKLPGPEVLNLFRFIDKDESKPRNGMLIFLVYTGHVDYSYKKKESEVAEGVLSSVWSPFVAKDSLESVLSRLCASIVKVT